MAIVVRRVFHGKPGSAEGLLRLIREGFELVEKRGFKPANVRLLTDYMSGRSDRVVEEMEFESLGQFEASLGKLVTDPGVLADLAALKGKVFELVDSTETELWSIR
jgi:hypothetical protein